MYDVPLSYSMLWFCLNVFILFLCILYNVYLMDSDIKFVNQLINFTGLHFVKYLHTCMCYKCNLSYKHMHKTKCGLVQ